MKNTGPITHAMLQATDIIRKMNGLKIYNSSLDILNVADLSHVINIIKKENRIDIYGIDIHSIVESESSFNDIGNTFGISPEVVYKIKGMFR